MGKRYLVARVISLLITLSSCGMGSSANFKITATLSDGKHNYTGNSIWKLTLYRRFGVTMPAYQVKIDGDAVPIQLPDGDVLLILPIGSLNAPDRPANMFLDLFARGWQDDRPDRITTVEAVARRGGLTRLDSCDYNEAARDPAVGDQPARSRTEFNTCLQLAVLKKQTTDMLLEAVPIGQISHALGGAYRLAPLRLTITTDDVTRSWFEKTDVIQQQKHIFENRPHLYGTKSIADWLRR